MAEPDNNPPEKKPSIWKQFIDDLSWDVPFLRAFGNLLLRIFFEEGKAVKHGWFAFAVLVVLAIWITHHWTEYDVDAKISGLRTNFNSQISELKGQLSEAKTERDKYQLMLAPFQAAALKIYTNEPLAQRLDLLANEIDEMSKQSQLKFWINDKTNLVTTDLPIGTLFTISNFITLNDRKIRIHLFNKSKFPAINSFVEFLVPLDPTNLNIDGWFLEPQSETGENHWRYDAKQSIPKNNDWHIATIEISTNFTGGYFIGSFDVGADNAETKRYFIGFSLAALKNAQ